MPENFALYISVYLAAVSLLAAIMTAFDKRAARRGSRRIRERTLLLVAVIGGSVAMFVVMRLIRHKTQHAKFTVGIPAIIILQIAAVLYVWWRMKGGS